MVAHEFLHGFGLWHEQQRPDRDDYVWLDWKNMNSGFEHAYKKCDHCKTYDVPYDHKSIMHYAGTAYCKKGYCMHSKVVLK